MGIVCTPLYLSLCPPRRFKYLARMPPVMDKNLASRWDEEYQRGRYKDEPHIGFVRQIIETLEENPRARAGRGLYIGCGSGRNYIPLADSGLDIIGIDISRVAIERLSVRAPGLAGNITHADFEDYEAGMFEYAVSIQTFQHGTQEKTAGYFAKVSRILRPGGLLFLRVNSSSTQIRLRHAVTEKGGSGGFTVRYLEGPKKDLDVRFYSLAELKDLCRGFDYVHPALENVTARAQGGGAWSQWELILKKND
ncbi:MAG: class I SAM-dependent methyltransferase [Nitrosopumilus sp. H8]|nr:MAG: class I SAM-dependent methyltransferase [Nitrosopumilus sp. H8]